MTLSEHIVHCCVKPATTLAGIEELCQESVEYGFKSVCVPPLFVKKAKSVTAGTGITIATVIGFPYGYSAIEAKVAETVLAIVDGADELAVVVNVAAIKNGDWQFLAAEINNLMTVIRSKGKKITLILETALMTDAEIITACDIYGAAGVDFIQVGTGTVTDARAAEQVRLIRKHLAGPVGIKAAFEGKHYAEARGLLNAGANHLCTGNSLALVQQSLQQN